MPYTGTERNAYASVCTAFSVLIQMITPMKHWSCFCWVLSHEPLSRGANLRLCSVLWAVRELESPLSSVCLRSMMIGSLMTWKSWMMKMCTAKCRGIGLLKCRKWLQPPTLRALKKSSPFWADKRKPIRYPMKHIRQTEKDNVCLEVLLIPLTFFPLTEQATAASFRLWSILKGLRFIFWQMNRLPESISIRCGQKLWRFTEAAISVWDSVRLWMTIWKPTKRTLCRRTQRQDRF